MVVLSTDAKLAKFLLSNPILTAGTPVGLQTVWLQIKEPGNPPALWLYIADEVYSPGDKRNKANS